MFERFRGIVSEKRASRQKEIEEEARIQRLLTEADEEYRQRVNAAIEERAEKRRGKYPGLDKSTYYQSDSDWMNTVTEEVMRKNGLL